MKRALVLVSLTLLACEDGYEGRPHWPVPGCESIDHRPCDVRDELCQDRLHALAGCLRGHEVGSRPTVSLMSQQEFLQYLEERAPEAPPSPDHYEEALTLFELAEPGALSPARQIEERGWIGGFFRSEDDAITLIDHGKPFDDPALSSLLVHELIHALQHRDVDLAVFGDSHDGSFDSIMKTRAVSEGEAKLHETRYAASAFGIDPRTLDWGLRFDSRVALAESDLREAGSPFVFGARRFPYDYGARFMHRIWARGGYEAVLGRFAEPPWSSHEVMASSEVDPFEPSAPGSPLPGEGWSLITDDALGAWGLFMAIVASSDDLELAHSLASAWRGDSFSVYAVAAGEPDAGVTAAVWRIDFADEYAAASAANTLEVAAPGGAEQQGTRMVAARTDAIRSFDWAFAP